jgi:hypothetical protein
MAEDSSQTYASHVRWHPPFHFFLMPGALLLLVLTVVNIVKHQALEDWILLLIGVLAPIAFLLIRTNPLRAQDRLIRLEERLRLSVVLNEPLRSRIADLTEGQLVALRFASDSELPGLVEKALASRMKGADIKKAIITWRPDTFRV